MKTSTTTTTEPPAGGRRSRAARRLPGWAWFVLLWLGGVAGALALGYAFKIFMNLTLFAVTK
ncbi:hypothetical protein [Burkholderia glumae]|uniref:hypothetical protein n=1 Tax=Burkholderia glumae TaxID=337 RepID=UPI000313234F|nr:hypothetical protein [Burkholderia glumae]PJO23317.1 hypothetical protein Y5A_009745 [Burkholderia glumae AU6208]QHE13942.1 hypothetical protein GQR88_27655 [Burkholderia glumae AU6208]UVS99583.1 hypothetical protein EFP19_28970 [Burkholderia glumae]